MTAAQHVVVLGGGVIGVATAWFLSRTGCRITLIERRNAAALETSFANGGLITPSMSDPWAAPETPLLMLKWMGREESPFLLRLRALPGLAPWGVKFLYQCSRGRWRQNTETALRLCKFSQESLRDLVQETGVEYESSRRGTLRLIRDSRSMDKLGRTAGLLRELGVQSRTLDPAACVVLEPALRDHVERIAGGIHYPDDEAGNARLFTQRLAAICASAGVTFRYGEAAEAIEVDGGRFSGVRTSAGRVDADACVVALGTGSTALLRPLGIGLPIYPVKGYSVTFPVANWNGAPVVPFTDEFHKVGIVRIGDCVRVAGTAEFAGYDKSPNARRTRHLRDVFLSLFPDYPDPGMGEEWAGLRPVTPQGTPYLGPTPIRGLYLNAGHGHLGWTMACGSARIVANLLRGQEPEIDLTGLTLQDR